MTSREWAAWVAYDRVRPIDSRSLAEIRHAELIAYMVQGFRSFGKRRARVRPREFWPHWLKRLARGRLDLAALERTARDLTIQAGGTVHDGDDREP